LRTSASGRVEKVCSREDIERFNGGAREADWEKQKREEMNDGEEEGCNLVGVSPKLDSRRVSTAN